MSEASRLQHPLRTSEDLVRMRRLVREQAVAATRLMGADCIISGIRPQIAQTIVHLGLDLGAVTTKATLADAFEVALKRSGARIVKSKSSHSPELEPESNT